MLIFFYVSFYPTSLASQVSKGVELVKNGRYVEAKALFEKHLDSHPDDPEAFFYLGTLEIDATKSQKFFRNLWIYHPHHPLADNALYAICQYHYAKGYYVSAGKMFRDLVETYSESEYADDASYWSASCYLAAEKPDSALTEWQAFLSTYPKSDLHDWAILGTGDAFFALGKYNEAVTEYRKIIDVLFNKDLKSTALHRLGQCYEHLGESETAQKYYDRILEECPQSYERILIVGQREKHFDDNIREGEVYTVQVGAFAHKENAVKLHDMLSQGGYKPEIVMKYKDDGTVLHAVQVGSYNSKDEARIVTERLKKEKGLNPRVLLKRTQ